MPVPSPEPPWPAPPSTVALAADDVHVWCVGLDPPAEHVPALAALLAPDERTRAARVLREERRQRFVVARGILRTLLARYLAADPAALRFEYEPHGKPALAGGALSFNLSHSHDVALVAVVRGRAIGIDVERVRNTLEVARLASRFFSAPEQASLEALPGAEQVDRFFRLWTAKEAYLKATGEGMSRALRTFDVTGVTAADAPHVRVGGTADRRFTLHLLQPDPGYAAALAVEGSVTGLRCWRWTW